MPVYNGEKYIKSALNSLLAQTLIDFELIISDNASVDRTEEICREYEAKDKRIRYIRQKKNRGPIWNFSFVLQKSVGTFFMWAAHDDLWDKSFAFKLIKKFETEPETTVAIASEAQYMINIMDRMVGKETPPP